MTTGYSGSHPSKKKTYILSGIKPNWLLMDSPDQKCYLGSALIKD